LLGELEVFKNIRIQYIDIKKVNGIYFIIASNPVGFVFISFFNQNDINDLANIIKTNSIHIDTKIKSSISCSQLQSLEGENEQDLNRIFDIYLGNHSGAIILLKIILCYQEDRNSYAIKVKPIY